MLKQMRLMMLLFLPAGLMLSAAGCGGGAAEVPTVTVKPAETGPAVADGTNGPTNGPTPTVSADGYGTFRGRVVLAGSPPSLAPLVAQGRAPRDPGVCAAGSPIPDESLLVQDGGLANVFVFLKTAPKNGKEEIFAESESALELDQKACIFIPHAMVVRAGKPIIVKNSDPVEHNVKTRPRVGAPFEATPKPGDVLELVFTRPEPIPVSAECNFHNWMKAYQLPLDHPYGVVTAADGSFEIPELPVGKHQFVIWHERSTRPLNSRFTVDIKSDGDVVEETIEVDAATLTEFGGAQTKSIKLSFNR